MNIIWRAIGGVLRNDHGTAFLGYAVLIAIALIALMWFTGLQPGGDWQLPNLTFKANWW